MLWIIFGLLNKQKGGKTMDDKLLFSHGGYRTLHSFQAAQIVYDGTVVFCERFIDKRSRTNDQMVQAARSGVQNIAEGSLASGTSKKTELKLTNVARASLGELLLDYEDFLRQNEKCIWNKDDSEALEVRNKFKQISGLPDNSNASDLYAFRELSSGDLANTIICLIHQASYLLFSQIKSLESKFIEDGGFSERMYSTRQYFKKNNRN
jgi:four helix bundle suffix protein